MKNSALSNIGINLLYTKGKPLELMARTEEPPASSYAITWCMLATGFFRIFTKEDMWEFLFRLSITLNSLSLVETWLSKDNLMNYRVRDNYYVLELNDIIEHFGIEIIDSIENHSPRESYLENIEQGIFNSMISGAISDFAVLEPVQYDNGFMFHHVEDFVPEVTPELLAKAEFFANDLMQFIPEETFTNRNPLTVEKEKEIEERKARIQQFPVFNISKLSKEIIKECLEIMFTDEYAEKLYNNPDLFEKDALPYIYLGWLLANDMMTYIDGGWLVEKEGVHLNLEDYELEDVGINLNETVDTYNIMEIVPLLKGLF